MDGALADLVRAGRISDEVAFKRCSDPDTLTHLLRQSAAGDPITPEPRRAAS